MINSIDSNISLISILMLDFYYSILNFITYYHNSYYFYYYSYYFDYHSYYSYFYNSHYYCYRYHHNVMLLMLVIHNRDFILFMIMINFDVAIQVQHLLNLLSYYYYLYMLVHYLIFIIVGIAIVEHHYHIHYLIIYFVIYSIYYIYVRFYVIMAVQDQCYEEWLYLYFRDCVILQVRFQVFVITLSISIYYIYYLYYLSMY